MSCRLRKKYTVAPNSVVVWNTMLLAPPILSCPFATRMDSWDGDDSSDDSAVLSGWGTADGDGAVFDRSRSEWHRVSRDTSTSSLARCLQPLPTKATTTTKSKKKKKKTVRLQLVTAQSTSALPVTPPHQTTTVPDQSELTSPPAASVVSSCSRAVGISPTVSPVRPLPIVVHTSSKATATRQSRAANATTMSSLLASSSSCKLVGLIGDGEEWCPMPPLLHRSESLPSHDRATDARRQRTRHVGQRDLPMRLVLPSLAGPHSLQSLLSALTLHSNSDAEQQQQRKRRVHDTNQPLSGMILTGPSSTTVTRARHTTKDRANDSLHVALT